MKYSILYRSCDRPKYVEKTLPILLERTSENAETILLFDNSTHDQRREDVRDIGNSLSEFFLFDMHLHGKERIGGTNAIVEGVKVLRQKCNLNAVMVVDDDIAVPKPVDGKHWDTVLIEMLEAGWGIVAHPWATDFRKNYEVTTIGGVKGYSYGGVGGGCSAFRLDLYDKHPMEQRSLIRGYNEWMVRWAKGKCGYSHDRQMVMEHIDRPDHPWSLRDTVYNEWSDLMYYERFPKAKIQGKKRPKGLPGSW